MNVTTSLNTLLGREAMDDLIRRGLLAVSPFSQFSTTPVRDTNGFNDAVQGARIGIRLCAAAKRLERQRPGSAQVLLPSLALTAAGSKGVHEIQLDLSKQIWSSGSPQAPEEIAAALRALPDTARGHGRAIKHLRHTPATIPWFSAGLNSYGYAGIMRTVGIAGLGPDAPSIAMADMAITHAHPFATWTAASLAAAISVCVNSDPADLGSNINELLRCLDPTPIGSITATFRFASNVPVAALAEQSFRGPTCESLLPVMFGAARTDEDPVIALCNLAAGGAPTPIVAVAGAILGARHGCARFPRGWSDPTVNVASNGPTDLSADHIWVLLDRSGSMNAIREAMEAGFDQFVEEQKVGVVKPTGVTVVQFDSQNPHEVVVDAPSITMVPSLKGRLRPRGTTPLYDAIALLLDRAEQDPRTGEQKLVVIITDGHENASRSVTQASIFKRISHLEDEGWTFVFLGANQDSYSAGASMHIPQGNVSNFTGSEEGVHMAYTGLSRATTEWREKGHHRRHDDRREFWGGVREAEDV